MRRVIPWTAAVVALCFAAGPSSAAESHGFEPTWRGAEGLEEALATFRRAASLPQPPPLATSRRLEPGDRGPEVASLRQRLAAQGGPVTAAAEDPQHFDDALAQAVREFQALHGLEPDAVVGPATRAELDRTPADRIRQLERVVASRRALPVELGERFLLVNLSAFTLEAFGAGRPALTLRVIVGQTNRRTPTLAAAVHGLVVHPPWNVPPRIARQEIAPRAARDPEYLVRQGIEVFADSGELLLPSGVDWHAFQRGQLALTLRQKPGPLAALGEVSFQFRNPQNVCLHDTPERGLFQRARRALSHGCMRVEHAVELARWVIGGEPERTGAALERALSGSATVHLELSTPLPIYVVDWPVWIDPGGVLQVRPEVYPLPATPSQACDCTSP